MQNRYFFITATYSLRPVLEADFPPRAPLPIDFGIEFGASTELFRCAPQQHRPGVLRCVSGPFVKHPAPYEVKQTGIPTNRGHPDSRVSVPRLWPVSPQLWKYPRYRESEAAQRRM
jgi:hypothetical protein